MQFCDSDRDSETVIIISDRPSDACQQFFDRWHVHVTLGLYASLWLRCFIHHLVLL